MGYLIRLSTLLLMVLSIGLSTQGGLIVQALFQLRQDYIATHHCENRAKPERKCHGKCFLKKHLHEAERQSKQNVSPPSASPVFHFLITGEDVPPPSPESKSPFVSRYSGVEQDGFAFLVDPPPRTS